MSKRIALSLIVIFIAVSAYPIWLGSFYGIGDMRDLFIPLEYFFQSEQLAGRLPAWNPDMAWGFPVIAAAQIGFFYPPLALIRWLPLSFYIPLIFFLHILLAGIGMYAWLREIKVSSSAAVLGALAFSLSSWLWQHAVHFNIILIASWLPLQFYLVHRATKSDRPPARILALLAIALGLPFLAGHIQLPAMLALVSLAYFISRLKTKFRLLSFALPLLLVVSATAAISAAQILPTWELFLESSRSQGGSFTIEQANQFSYPIYHLPTILWPRFFGNQDTYWGKRLQVEYGFFIGTVPLILALYTTAKRPRANLFLITLAIISFLLALGDASPFRILGIEPTFGFFTSPARWLLFTTFALSSLAAKGFDHLKERQWQIWIKTFITLIVASVISYNIILNTLPSDFSLQVFEWLKTHAPATVENRPADYYLSKFDQILFSARNSALSFLSPWTVLPIITSIAAMLLSKHRRGTLVILLVCAVELAVIAGSSTPSLSWKNILRPPDSLSALPLDVINQQARILSIRRDGDTGALLTNPASRLTQAEQIAQYETLIPLSHTMYNVAGVEWPASLDIQRQNDALTELRRGDSYYLKSVEAVANLNIGAIVTPRNIKPAPELSPETLTDEVAIYKLPQAPRAEIVTKTTHIPVMYEPVNPSKIIIQAITPVAATIVVRDTWYPGWRATVDGKEAKIKLVENLFRGVDVGPGQHTIIMEYYPSLVWYGLSLSIIGLLSCIIMAKINPFRQAKSAPEL